MEYFDPSAPRGIRRGKRARAAELLGRAEQLLQGVNPPDDFDVTTPTITSRMRFGDRLVRTVSTIAWPATSRGLSCGSDAAGEAFFVESSER